MLDVDDFTPIDDRTLVRLEDAAPGRAEDHWYVVDGSGDVICVCATSERAGLVELLLNYRYQEWRRRQDARRTE